MLVHTQVRKSPYWRLCEEAGCRTYTVLSNTYHPREYIPEADGGLLQEHDHVIRGLAVWDEAPDRQMAIRGPDALAFADYLVTRNLDGVLPVGRACYALVCDESGGIVGDPVLLRVSEREIWVSGNVEILHFAKGVRVHSGFDVAIEEVDVSPLHLHGPKSRSLMEQLAASGQIGQEVLDLGRYTLCQTSLNGIPLIVLCMALLGTTAYELYPFNASDNGEAVGRAVVSAGAPFGIRITGPGNIRRLEAGIKSYHADLDTGTNPFEVGLDWQVQIGEKQFVGKQALARIQRDGVTRKLVGVMYHGPPVTQYNPDPWPLSDACSCTNVGYVTTTFWSPERGANVGFAMLPLNYAEAGTTLVLWRPDDGAQTATVTNIPFVRPAA